MESRITSQSSFDIVADADGWVCDRFLQSGDRPEYGIPHPMRSGLARLLSNRMLLKSIRKGTAARIGAPAGRHLICVELSEGELIVAKMRRLVGMIGASFAGLRFSGSAVAFSLGHTLLHGFIGPGRVFFESTSMSVEAVSGDQSGRRSFDPRSLVCLRQGTKFTLTSAKSFWSLTHGNWQLEVVEGCAVFDLGVDGDSGVGLWELAGRLYLPWR